MFSLSSPRPSSPLPSCASSSILHQAQAFSRPEARIFSVKRFPLPALSRSSAVSLSSSSSPPAATSASGAVTAERPFSMASTGTATPLERTAPALDAEKLVSEMRKAFRSGVTRDLRWREEQLQKVALMCRERQTEFFAAVEKDLGRGQFDSFAEVLMPAQNAVSMAKDIKKWAKPVKVPTDTLNFPGQSQIVSEPYGVVLILCPWNFPFTLFLEPLIGALAAGNAVVLKPSELSPCCSSLLAKVVAQYLDSQAVRVVEGGPEVAQALLEQKWDKIFFTGGTEVGRKVAMAAAKHLTPVTLELGGKNPCYLDDSADIPVVARRIVYGAFTNAGQICLAPEYILAQKSVVDELVDTLKKTTVQFYGEDPSKSPDMARIVNEKHFDRIKKLLADPEVAAQIVHGGESDRESRYISPTILRDVPWDSEIMEQETFGPILTVQTVSSVDEAITIINDRPKPLALYVFTSRDSVMQRFTFETSSGAIAMNETVTHICNPNLPFGGVGDSGMGAYHGRFSFDCFSHQKGVLKKGTGGDIPMRYPPSTPFKLSAMMALFNFDILGFILILLGWKK